MRSAEYYLSEYAKDHQDPVNQVLHKICVPAIMVSLLGLLWSIPVPGVLAALGPYANWATAFIMLAMVYYAVLSWRCVLGMLPVVVISILAVRWLNTFTWPLWQTSLAIFVVAWIGQFIGHAVEGRRPAFFRDLQFLLIGPLWVFAGAYRRLGFALAESQGAR
ncbi:MAG: DUF962 domain-containing protein [Gammaproteobacteria bacterium]|nr:DUF962 domain-containing protein [Gammaproteobacteria bacterium]MBT8445073.1 DUF962 domain-containing protein [Gammaproteobacteria bacterium]